MISGPVVVQVLEGADAVAKNRNVMGATNPADAAEGTIRKAFAESIEARCTGRTAPKTRPMKSRFSSLARILLAKPTAARPTQKPVVRPAFFDHMAPL